LIELLWQPEDPGPGGDLRGVVVQDPRDPDPGADLRAR
jgi:hypothetical protein